MANRKPCCCKRRDGWTWSVGVTTAPRRVGTLEQTLSSLKSAGWEDVRIFAEPDSPLPKPSAGYQITQRDEALGAFANWYLGLSELYLREPRADAYLICQDDVLLAEGLRAYLEGTLWPSASVGVVSVYCPGHVSVGMPSGFHVDTKGWQTWGALAYVFSNPSVRAFLSDPIVLNHSHHGPDRGRRNIDSLVGAWCERRERPYFVHVPSLAQHIGETTTVWSRDGCDNRRRASQFIRQITLTDTGLPLFELE